MSKEVVDQANAYVMQLESNYADELIADIHAAKKAMDGCGCPQCKSWFWGAVARAEAERDRLIPPELRPLLPSGDVLDDCDSLDDFDDEGEWEDFDPGRGF